jgi:hypothetical protein
MAVGAPSSLDTPGAEARGRSTFKEVGTLIVEARADRQEREVEAHVNGYSRSTTLVKAPKG